LRDTYQASTRRICGLIDLERSSFYYQEHGPDDGPLREALRDLAHRYPRWGYQTLTELLREDGSTVNHKRVHRVYREAGLQVRRRKRLKAAPWRGEALESPRRLNQCWGMDFVSDQLEDGRRLRILVVLDLFSRACLALEVDTSLSAYRVIRVLERLIEQRGAPETILTDNGPEFTSRAMDRWAYAREFKQQFIEPGKPMQNGFVEGFNSTLRDQCLNQHWFADIQDARQRIEEWRQLYNTVKPHSALGRKPPAAFADAHAGHARHGHPLCNRVDTETTGALSSRVVQF
jgi:putative transposase